MSATFINNNILFFSDKHSLFSKIIDLDQSSFPFPWSRESWLKASSYRLLILTDGDNLDDCEVLGFILYEIYENFEQDAPVLNSYIHKIVTASHLRGQGVGQGLIQYFAKSLIHKKCLSVYLDVQEKNESALRFYEKAGFKKLFCKNKFYSNGDNSLYCLMSL